MGNLMPAILATGIAAREHKQGRRTGNNDPSNVARLGAYDVAPCALPDLEAQGQKSRQFTTQAGSFVLAAAPFGEALSRFPMSSIVVHVSVAFRRWPADPRTSRPA